MAGSLQRLPVSITTSSDEAGTGYADYSPPQGVTGRLTRVEYVAGGFSSGATAVITAESSGVEIWSGSLNGALALSLDYPLFADRIKIVIAAGGNAQTGKFNLYVE